MASPVLADVYTTDAAPTAIPDLAVASLALDVDGSFEVDDLNVILSLEHEDLSELRVSLESSDGTEVVLLDGQATGSELRFTSFDDEANQPIPAGSSPFTASFTPAEGLAAFDGKTSSGTWTLLVEDLVAGGTGEILCFSLAFNGTTIVAPEVDVPVVDFDTTQLTLDVPGLVDVADVDLGFDLIHTFPGDLSFYLAGPAGVAPELHQNLLTFVPGLRCITLDDEASVPFDQSFSTGPGRFTTDSGDALSFFDGTQGGGTWYFSIVDSQFEDAGILRAWWLHVTSAAPSGPFDPCDVVSLAGPSQSFTSGVDVEGERAAVGDLAAEVVGSFAGTVRVYESFAGSWMQSALLVPLSSASNDRFGITVELEGTTLLAGAPGCDTAGPDAGAVFVFEEQLSGWTETDLLVPSGARPFEGWGSALAFEGDLAVLGHGDSPAGPQSAYIFRRDGDAWSEVAMLTAPGPTAPVDFGTAVATDGVRVLVGARGSAGQAGSAYLFEDGPGGWQLTAELPAPASFPTHSFFGEAVALEGPVALIGSPSAFLSEGRAVVFEELVTGSWSETAQLLPQGLSPIASFGESVDVTGDRLAVGTGPNQRDVFVFGRSASGWSELLAVDEVGLDAGSIALREDRLLIAGGLQKQGTLVGVPSTQTLYACEQTVSVSGGSQDLELYAGPQLASALYLVLGSASGSAPGIAVETLQLPLNLDSYLLASLASANQPPFVQTLGVLDDLGRATASITLAPGSPATLVGLELNHAYVAFDVTTLTPLLASSAVPLAVVP